MKYTVSDVLAAIVTPDTDCCHYTLCSYIHNARVLFLPQYLLTVYGLHNFFDGAELSTRVRFTLR